ncbi:hypothetical protein Tco_1104681 [Tanacetum coccineum]
MEEYIKLEVEKARRRGQEFSWETASYGKVRYFVDINHFKDFENEFPAIVYKDTLTSEPKVSSEPMDLTKRKDDCGWILFFLKSYVFVVRGRIQTRFRTHNLAHKRNMEDHTEQI